MFYIEKSMHTLNSFWLISCVRLFFCSFPKDWGIKTNTLLKWGENLFLPSAGCPAGNAFFLLRVCVFVFSECGPAYISSQTGAQHSHYSDIKYLWIFLSFFCYSLLFGCKWPCHKFIYRPGTAYNTFLSLVCCFFFLLFTIYSILVPFIQCSTLTP